MAIESMKDRFVAHIRQLQDEICAGLEKVDGKAKFEEDIWERDGGGGGRTRVISNGGVFEKGGVNTSVVHGKMPEVLKSNMGASGTDFFACGLSLVIHPNNPMIPTVHANWRYFEMYDEQGQIVDAWFGGGSDLTPYYLFEEDAIHFHKVQKSAADKHGEELYPKYKKRCDEYFWNHHRNEARGVGGTFFDYLKADDQRSLEDWMLFDMEMGNCFLEGYLPIVQKRMNLPFTEQQKYWQEIRRGRYVEFNLVHDKGTLFGLKTNGRIESILMSLPATVRWDYCFEVEEGSEESKLVSVLEEPRNWLEI